MFMAQMQPQNLSQEEVSKLNDILDGSDDQAKFDAIMELQVQVKGVPLEMAQKIQKIVPVLAAKGIGPSAEQIQKMQEAAQNNPRLRPQFAQVDPEAIKDWETIYPAYINKNFSLKQGRRLAKEKAVDNPNIHEMAQCLALMKLKHCIEPNKKYPRDQLHQGRVRIQFTDPATGQLHNQKYSNKQQVMEELGLLIPKLKQRVAELAQEFQLNQLPRHKRKKAIEQKNKALAVVQKQQ